MKKTLLIIAVVTMLLLTGLSSAASINIRSTLQNKHTFEKSTYNLETEIPKPINVEAQGWWDWYKDFVSRQGIKIWARGYGTFWSEVIDEDDPNYEYVEYYGEDHWIVSIWLPEKCKIYDRTDPDRNGFKYSFYDEDAETRTNHIILPMLFLPLIIDRYLPNFLNRLRFNSKIPTEGTGKHTMNAGYLFMGTITKGQTYDGQIKDPIWMDIDGDGVDEEIHFYEIRGRCTGTSFIEYNADRSNFLKGLLNLILLKNDDGFIPW